MTLTWKGTYKEQDIKCPFDCLFHYFTRKYEVFASGNQIFVDRYKVDSYKWWDGNKPLTDRTPEGFDTW